MVGGRLHDTITRRPWAVPSDYADEEDYQVELWTQHREDYERYLEVLQSQDDIPGVAGSSEYHTYKPRILGRMERGERFAHAYDQVRKEYANDFASRCTVELEQLYREADHLDQAFNKSIDTWKLEEPAAYDNFRCYFLAVFRSTTVENRRFAMLQWYPRVPEYVTVAIQDLQRLHDKISRRRLQHDDAWHWYSRTPHRDAFYGHCWSAMWGEKDVLFGHEFEFHPNGFHDVEENYVNDEQSFRNAVSAWRVKSYRLRQAIDNLKNGTGLPCDLLVPQSFELFGNKLKGIIDGILDGVRAPGRLEYAWLELRDEIRDEQEERVRSCDYNVAGMLAIDDRCYGIDLSEPANDGYGEVMRSKPSSGVVEWLRTHTHDGNHLIILRRSDPDT